MMLIKEKQISDWVKEARNDAIEECARVAESELLATFYPIEQKKIAAAIRALRDKPN